MRRLCIAVTMAAAACAALAHMEMPVPVDGVIRESTLVGVARVARITVRESRCDVTTTVTLSPERFLKGSLDKNEILFSYTHFYWKRATWPWQEDCPSVDYTVPPVARGMKEGDRVIFAARYFPDRGDYFAVATMRMEQLETVKELLHGK
ncbi:MAG: hypothetical protein JXA20_06665 [Spirochaetes bacterium]|nr:hypothetical protein [Spirochaetota bacterium]